MRSKHRQHLTAASLQKQKQDEAQNKIKTALRNVDEAAKAALHTRRVVVVTDRKDGGDGISSVTVERRVPGVVKLPSAMSPAVSDVTNQVQLNSFDETSKALFSEKQSMESGVKSYSNSHDSGRTNGEIEDDESSKENHLPIVSAAVDVEPNFKLSPRRQWELEPFQNALKQFPLINETRQPSSKREVPIDGRSNMLQSFRDSLNLDIIGNEAAATTTKSASKPPARIHSVLDLVSQLINSNAVDASSDCRDEALDKVVDERTHSVNDHESCPQPAVPSKRDTSNSENNKCYIFQEDSNGAGYIICDQTNYDTETIEGSLHFESNQKAEDYSSRSGSEQEQVDLNASSDSEQYDDSFHSED